MDRIQTTSDGEGGMRHKNQPWIHGVKTVHGYMVYHVYMCVDHKHNYCTYVSHVHNLPLFETTRCIDVQSCHCHFGVPDCVAPYSYVGGTRLIQLVIGQSPQKQQSNTRCVCVRVFVCLCGPFGTHSKAKMFETRHMIAIGRRPVYLPHKRR